MTRVIPAELEGRGRRAALAVSALVVVTLAVNLAWIVRHLDWLRPLEAGQAAPAFALPVLGAGGQPTGETLTNERLRGKVVVLEFWATWCGPCLQSLPHVDAAARGWGDRVAAVAVNLDDRAKARAIFEAKGWRLILAGSDEDLALRYGVDMLPHVVVIDQQGVVRLVARGGQGVAQARAAVARLLGP